MTARGRLPYPGVPSRTCRDLFDRPAEGIELFSGCGGLSTGFLDAGLGVLAGFEREPRAVQAFGHNHRHRGAVGVPCDLLRDDAETLKRAIRRDRLDFVVGGPPCQPFSDSGKRLGLLDPRARCVARFAELALAFEPAFVVMENVAPILRYGVLPGLESDFAARGYRVGHAVLDASWFGVPQRRKRFFLVAMRDVGDVTFPEPTHGPRTGLPYATVAQALDDLPDADDFGACGVHNHEPPHHGPDMVATFAALKPGQRDPSSRHVRLRAGAPSVTLRAGSGNFTPLRPVHHRHDRVVTVRESARLHGYADDFVWPDTVPRLHQYRQVGNSVPPALGAVVARHVARRLGMPLHEASLADDGTPRPPSVTMDDEARRALRARRTRTRS